MKTEGNILLKFHIDIYIYFTRLSNILIFKALSMQIKSNKFYSLCCSKYLIFNGFNMCIMLNVLPTEQVKTL